MEHFKVDVIIGQGAGAQSITIPLNPFTLLGATTKAGMLSAPLRSRFGIIERLDFYQEDELQAIILQSAHFLGLPISPSAALHIAAASRGTPRIAKRIVRRIRDFTQALGKEPTDAIVKEGISFLSLDEEGLTPIDHMILTTLLSSCNGGPIGIETLASLVGEDAATLEEAYEPFLLRKGYLEKTSRGRQIPHNKVAYMKNKFFGQSPV